MSSKQARQARDAEANKARRAAARGEREANKARRAAARGEREAKRAAAAPTNTTPTTESAPATPKAKGQSQATSRQSRPPEQTILVSDVAVYAPEDREGRLAIFLMICVLALLALLIIAVLTATST